MTLISKEVVSISTAIPVNVSYWCFIFKIKECCFICKPSGIYLVGVDTKYKNGSKLNQLKVGAVR